MPISTPLTINAFGTNLMRLAPFVLDIDENVLDVSTLRLKSGATILPATFTVFARWSGIASDTSKPIKMAHVSFKDTGSPRALTIDDAGGAVPAQSNPLAITDNANDIVVSNGLIAATFNKTTNATDLLTSVNIGGEILHASNKPKLTVPVDLKTKVTYPTGGSAFDYAGTPGQSVIKVLNASIFSVGQEIEFRWQSTVTNYIASYFGGSLIQHDPNHNLPDLTQVLMDSTHRLRVIVDFGGGSPTDNNVRFYSTDGWNVTAPATPTPTVGMQLRIKEVEDQAPMTISAINTGTNEITLTAPLTQYIPQGVDVVPTAGGGTIDATLHLNAGGVTIERQRGDKSYIIKQVGVLKDGGGTRIGNKLTWELRHHLYADTPFIRTDITWRQVETVPTNPECPDEYINAWTFSLPTAAASTAASDEILTRAASITRYKANNLHSVVTHSAIADFEWAAYENAVQSPASVSVGASGCVFNGLHNTGTPHRLRGSAVHTRTIFWGLNASDGFDLLDSPGVQQDPEYVAASGALRRSMIPKRDWDTEFALEPQKFRDACNRLERTLACFYDVSQAEPSFGSRPAMSLYEYRWDYPERMHGPTNYDYFPFGWDRWGNTPDENFGNNRYDLPVIVMLEGFREDATAKAQLAWKLGFQQIRNRFQLGQYWSNQWFNGVVGLDLKGLARYERSVIADPLTAINDRDPNPTHSWNEGTLLYAFMTDDPLAIEAARAGADQAAQYNYNGTANALLFGTGAPQMGSEGNAGNGAEPRYVAWPIHNLVTGYRYFGDALYLTRAQQYSQSFIATLALEPTQDGFIDFRTGSDRAPLFQHTGYCMAGIIEAWRESPSGATKTALGDYIVKVAKFIQKGDFNAGSVTANAPMLTAGKAHPTNPSRYNSASHMPFFYLRSFADTLASGISDTATTIPLAGSASTFVYQNSGTTSNTKRGVLIPAGELNNPANWEYFTYTGASGNNLTGVTRGFDGTTARAFSAGDIVYPTGLNGTESDLLVMTLIMGARISGDVTLQQFAQLVWEDSVLYRYRVDGGNPTHVTVGDYAPVNLWPLNVSTNGLKTMAQGANALALFLGDRVNPPDAPNISGLVPSSTTAGAAEFTLTVNGSDFASDAEVRWNATTLVTTLINDGQLTATVPAGLVTTAGTATITVRNVGDNLTSNGVNFTINPAGPSAPGISSISPNTGLQNVATGAITITGTNLTGASVTVAGSAVTPTSNTATEIVLPSQTFNTTGVKAVVVTTAGGSANTSINISAPPAPTISSRTPTTAVQNVATGPITINGTNLGSATVTVDGNSVTPTTNTATQIVLPSQTFTTTGVKTIAVNTTGGSVNTTITVNAPAPPPVPTTGGITLTGATNVVLGNWAGLPAIINTAPTGGANSTEQIPAGKTGFVQVQLLTQKQDTHVGLSSALTGTNAAAINFAIHFRDDYTIAIKQAGTVIYATGSAPNQVKTWEVGQQFQIYLERDRILFMEGWKVFHQVARPAGVDYRFACATAGLTAAIGVPILRTEGVQ